jgi:hypothetical protein
MPFNFKQYTANNPLLQEYISSDEYDYMNDDEIEAAEKDGRLNPSNQPLGPDSTESKFPRVEFEDAVRKALQAGVDRDTLHKIIDWN